MKKFIPEFIKRGLMSAGGGPVILAIVYQINGKTGIAENLPYNEVFTGIISITFMAFIAGGMTGIYQNEKLPVVSSALIHAAVLYLDYIIVYLLNDWIPKNAQALGIFTAIFFTVFALVWLVIYLCIRKQTESLNNLRKKT